MIKELITDKEILSQTPEPATAEDAQIVEDLVDTIKSMDDCACLAANQIGVTKAIAVFQLEDEEPTVLLNPKIKQAMRPYKAFETCLTLEGESAVTRYEDIKITYDEIVDGELVHKQKKFSQWPAEVVQHCIDHCRGRLV